ncbi:MAG: hypothetical protein Q4E34_04935 [Synergistaceae bacterium]|nr:hypothetical protein [Synergistaceae bacterium]
MFGIHPKKYGLTENENTKTPRSLKVFSSKMLHDVRKAAKKFAGAKHTRKLQILVVPVFLIMLTASVTLLPGANNNTDAVKTNILRVNNPAVSLAYDQDANGNIVSAWLRTPKASRRIGQLDGLSYIADSKFFYDVDGDKTPDLLWRISFNNENEKAGIHLWVGVLSRLAKIYVCSSPYEYTRWDAVPTKIRTPKNCALYVSPSIPATTLSGKRCYSFIYTIKLTSEGPAFIPVPDVYKQLLPILRSVISTEKNNSFHRAYVRMFMEYKNLSEGKVPLATTFTNLTIDNIELLPMK